MLRAREAEYKQLEVFMEDDEWATQKPYDPYQETDVRTPASAMEFSARDSYKYASGTTAVATPRGMNFEDPFLSAKETKHEGYGSEGSSMVKAESSEGS